MKAIDQFYLQQEEPVKSCFLVLKEIILLQDPAITNELKYGMPFFSYKGKMFCYLWYHKKYRQPYIGIVEGNRFEQPFLIQEKRSRMKIMLIDANEDLPVKKIKDILKQAINLYKTGEIKIRK
ncbi:MAG: DUF1801 domain-containing protein [Ferruginibacter sp.]